MTTAVLGAQATYRADRENAGTVFAIAAAISVALVPIVGREILEVGTEGKWLRARATAEMIKSVCYCFAAGAGASTEDQNAEFSFHRQLDEIESADADAGVTKADTREDDYKGPPRNTARDWYEKTRLDEQAFFFQKRQQDTENVVHRSRRFSLTFSVLSAVLRVLAGLFREAPFASAIAPSTPVAAAFTAYGQIDRRHFLAAS